MKYLYNPVTDQLDDVETPKLGEKYFASAETDEIIKSINEKHGPGTLFPASDLPPIQDPFKEFEIRNPRQPAAIGGRIEFSNGSPGGVGGGFRSDLYGDASNVKKLKKYLIKKIKNKDFRFESNMDLERKFKVDGHVIAKILKEPQFKKLIKSPGNLAPDKTGIVKKGGKIQSISFANKETKNAIKKIMEDYMSKPRPPNPNAESLSSHIKKLQVYLPNLSKDSVRTFSNFARGPKGFNLKRELITPGTFLPRPGGSNVSQNILRDIVRYIDAGGEDFKFAKNGKANLYRDLKIIDKKTGDLLTEKTINNFIKNKDSRFINYAKVFEESNFLKKIEYINPISKEKTTLLQALEQMGFYRPIHRHHIENVTKNPLKIANVTWKQNQDAKRIKSAPEAFKSGVQTVDESGKIIGPKISFDKFKKDMVKFTDRMVFRNLGKKTRDTVFKDEYLQKKKVSLTNRLNSGIPIDSILTTIADDLKIPLDKVMKVGGKFLRSAGKAAVVLDPMFAAFDFSEATGKGLSGKQSTSYMVQRFFEGLANLPALAIGAGKYGIDKLQGEDAKFETPYEATFAQDYLKEKAEEIPEEVKKARAAKIEFDTTILPSLTDVDDTEISASKAEIDAAEDKFMEAKGVDLSVIDEYEELLRGEPTFLGRDMDNSVSKAMSQSLADGGRINFANGSPRGPNEPEGNDFLNKLEFNFNNIDDVTIDDTPTTFDDSKSKIAQVADLADPRNIPYYADMAAQAALRVGEFGARVLPATGKLISDVLQKPMFKVKSSYLREGDGEILDYGETTKEDNVKFVGGPIFKNFLENITPTSTEKLVGLDTIINEEKKKMIARGSSSLPVKVGETAALGGELVAPIFPGLKILRAFASAKGVKPTKEVAKTIEQQIDAMAKAEGMSRREFLQLSGAVGTIGLAKLLGISSELPKIAKTAEAVTSVAKTSDGIPQYLYNLKNVIRLRGKLQPSSSTFLDGQEVYTYKGITLYHNSTAVKGDGSFRIAKEFETNSTVPGEPSYNKVEMEVKTGEDVIIDEGLSTQKIVKAGDEYEEATAYPAREGGEDVDFYVEDDFHKQLEEISKELEEIDNKVEMFGYDK